MQLDRDLRALGIKTKKNVLGTWGVTRLVTESKLALHHLRGQQTQGRRCSGKGYAFIWKASGPRWQTNVSK